MNHKLLAGAVLGLGLSINTQAAPPSVAVDIAPLHSLVSQIMEGVGEPNLLIPAEASPHHYALRPSEAKALADADVVFWIGEGLTPWLEKAMDNLAASANKVEVLEIAGTTTHGFREGATFEGHDHGEEEGHHEEGHDDHHDEHKDHKHHDDHHDDHKEDKHHDHHDEHKGHKHHDDHHDDHKEDKHHDHHDDHKGHDDYDDHKDDRHAKHDEHHHDHEGNDPHAWLDPENAKVWVKSIAATLSKQDPENANTYSSNAAKAITALDQLIASTQEKIHKLGQPQFIVFHDAYQYFERRFGISAAGAISLGDAEDPSPARIKEIRDTVKKLGVNCVFTEPQYNAGLVKNVFDTTSVTTIGVMDPLGSSLAEGSSHYEKLIQAMVNSISECK